MQCMVPCIEDAAFGFERLIHFGVIDAAFIDAYVNLPYLDVEPMYYATEITIPGDLRTLFQYFDYRVREAKPDSAGCLTGMGECCS